MNKTEKIIFAILIIVIFGMAGYFTYLQIRANSYEQGLEDGRQVVYLTIIDELTRHGYTTITITQDNETITLRLGVLG